MSKLIMGNSVVANSVSRLHIARVGNKQLEILTRLNPNACL